MDTNIFDTTFAALTGYPPFPWQRALYERFISDRTDNIPASCNLPTGLGKTSVIAIWLIALATPGIKMPRRLVYVVNRRTVVDQTTDEAEKLQKNLHEKPELQPLGDSLGDLVISTLRGQFADNREWSADPSRPAIICGTVDMIGSRLLFSGYGVGRNSKPLHAGFLGQDVLLVHDEAHLEPAFQKLLIAIEKEQNRCNEFGKFRVMELSATSRGDGEVFPNDDEKRANEADPTVQKRIGAKKTVHLVKNQDEKKLAEEMAKIALGFKDSKQAILIFAVGRAIGHRQLERRVQRQRQSEGEVVQAPLVDRRERGRERGGGGVRSDLAVQESGHVGAGVRPRGDDDVERGVREGGVGGFGRRGHHELAEVKAAGAVHHAVGDVIVIEDVGRPAGGGSDHADGRIGDRRGLGVRGHPAQHGEAERQGPQAGAANASHHVRSFCIGRIRGRVFASIGCRSD